MNPTTLKGKTLVAYLRVSSDKQDAQRQRQAIDAWAEKHGLAIADRFEDSEGRNPRDMPAKRKEFQRLLKAVESGRIDAVVVDSQDRFGTKNAHQFGKYVSHLTENGVELWSTTQGILSGDDPASILSATVSAITSTKEQQEKAYRNVSGKLQKAKLGEYQGGYPPYGFDVVCFDQHGKEKWRVLYTGHYQRIKIQGKKRERFDGKNNSPAKDPTDTLRVRPSVETDRLKTVKKIFQWYADECISPTQIATRLNKLGIDPIFGTAWNKQKVKEFLRNPVYIGLPTWNKRGGSRFAEYTSGEIKKVEPTKGKVKLGRKRKPADFIQPEQQQFRPIVPQTLFERVQAKLEASSKEHNNPSRRPPRTEALWLRGLLICWKCKQPMRANSSTKSRNVASYFCGAYGNYGNDNPSKCRCHRVRHSVLESIVQTYLDEAHAKVAKLVKAVETQSLKEFAPLEKEFQEKQQQLTGLIAGMDQRVAGYMQRHGGKKVLGQYLDESKNQMPKNGRPASPLEGLFAFVFSKEAPAVESRIAELDAEHTELVDRVLSLPKKAGDAIAKANKRILALESEMHGLRANLDDLGGRFGELVSELDHRAKAIESAREAIQSKSNFRRKAELVRSVIDRIVLQFRYSDERGANRPKSYLSKVQIFPLVGDPVSYKSGDLSCLLNGNSLAPNS